jgi:hypothetical protein
MSTKTVRKPKGTSKLPEWRRICHVYRGWDLRSICGTATRRLEEAHSYEECTARGHSICVVCAEIGGPESYMR